MITRPLTLRRRRPSPCGAECTPDLRGGSGVGSHSATGGADEVEASGSQKVPRSVEEVEKSLSRAMADRLNSAALEALKKARNSADRKGPDSGVR